MQRNKITTNNPDSPLYMSLKQKRSKLLSFFPSISSSKNNNAPENHHLDTESAIYRNTARDTTTVPAARVSTSTSVSLSSSSTISSASAVIEPQFHANNPSRIPEYIHLRKYLSRYKLYTYLCWMYLTIFVMYFRFQNKLKLREDILKLQLLPWFRKYTLRVYLCRERALCKQDPPQNMGSFWGLKSSAKEKKELEFGRLILLRW
jgi:hypothetical protein